MSFDPAKIRACRERKNLTLEQVADKAGIWPQNLSDIEMGKRPMTSFPTIARIADALGVSVNRLLESPAKKIPQESASTSR